MVEPSTAGQIPTYTFEPFSIRIEGVLGYDALGKWPCSDATRPAMIAGRPTMPSEPRQLD